MTQSENAKGSCLCGAVSLEIEDLDNHLGACHCHMCRKWGGGPLMALVGSKVSIKGEKAIKVFDSSAWAERGFCRECGTHLFYRIKETQQYHIPVGLLEKEFNIDFNLQVFIDEKPSYYDFANQTEMMTGTEVFAKYAPDTEAT